MCRENWVRVPWVRDRVRERVQTELGTGGVDQRQRRGCEDRNGYEWGGSETERRGCQDRIGQVCVCVCVWRGGGGIDSYVNGEGVCIELGTGGADQRQ